jgi:hypothetical protein
MGKQKSKPQNYVGRSKVEGWRAAGQEWVTSDDIARALGVTTETIRGAAGLPYTIVTGRGDRRYLVDDVEAWLLANTVVSKGPGPHSATA